MRLAMDTGRLRRDAPGVRMGALRPSSKEDPQMNGAAVPVAAPVLASLPEAPGGWFRSCCD